MFRMSKDEHVLSGDPETPQACILLLLLVDTHPPNSTPVFGKAPDRLEQSPNSEAYAAKPL